MFRELYADWDNPLLRNNYFFTFAVFCLGSISGPAASILYSAAAIWAITSIGIYRFDILESRTAKLVALIFAVYYFSGLANAIIHWGDRQSLILVVERLPFLGFLFVLSRLALSRPAAILESIEAGALAGSVAGFSIACVQYLSGDLRTAAFSGNFNLFAFTSGVSFVICLNAARRHSGSKEILFLLGSLCAFMSILLSGSKGVLFAAVAAGIVILWVQRAHVDGRRLPATGIAFGVSAIMMLLVAGNLPITKRFQTLGSDIAYEASGQESIELQSRIRIWRCGLEVGLKHPFAGNGNSGATKSLSVCGAKNGVDGHTTQLVFTHFHNFIIDSFAKGGLLMVIATILMAVTPLLAQKAIVRSATGALEQLSLASSGFASSIFVLTTVNGLYNVFLGNDVHDSYFIYLVICACALSGNTNQKQSKIVSQASPFLPERPLKNEQ